MGHNRLKTRNFTPKFHIHQHGDLVLHWVNCWFISSYSLFIEVPTERAQSDTTQDSSTSQTLDTECDHVQGSGTQFAEGQITSGHDMHDRDDVTSKTQGGADNYCDTRSSPSPDDVAANPDQEQRTSSSHEAIGK